MMSSTSRRCQDYQQRGSRPWENQQRWQFSSSPPLWNRLAGEIQVQTCGTHIQKMFALKSSWPPHSELNLCKEWWHSLVLPGIETSPTLQSVLIIHILGHVWLDGECESCIEYSSRIIVFIFAPSSEIWSSSQLAVVTRPKRSKNGQQKGPALVNDDEQSSRPVWMTTILSRTMGHNFQSSQGRNWIAFWSNKFSLGLKKKVFQRSWTEGCGSQLTMDKAI